MSSDVLEPQSWLEELDLLIKHNVMEYCIEGMAVRLWVCGQIYTASRRPSDVSVQEWEMLRKHNALRSSFLHATRMVFYQHDGLPSDCKTRLYEWQNKTLEDKLEFMYS